MAKLSDTTNVSGFPAQRNFFSTGTFINEKNNRYSDSFDFGILVGGAVLLLA